MAAHGAASLYRCVSCASQAEDYALQPGRGRLTEPVRGRRYSPDPDDYVPMCRACHRPLDVAEANARSNAASNPGDQLPGVDWAGYICPPELHVLQPWSLWGDA